MESKKTKSLCDEAYNRIENLIVTAKIKPGTIVTESELCDLTHLGRTPVREALKKLEPTHAIEIMPRKGYLVRIVSIDELLQQMEPRKVIEELSVKRASRYAYPEERTKLIQLAKEYRKITKEWRPADEALEVDDEFNNLLCAATRNIFIEEILPPMHLLARRQYYLNYFVDKNLTSKVNISHAKLMEAIASGDEKKALEELDELFENLRVFNSMSLSTWLPL